MNEPYAGYSFHSPYRKLVVYHFCGTGELLSTLTYRPPPRMPIRERYDELAKFFPDNKLSPPPFSL